MITDGVESNSILFTIFNADRIIKYTYTSFDYPNITNIKDFISQSEKNDTTDQVPTNLLSKTSNIVMTIIDLVLQKEKSDKIFSYILKEVGSDDIIDDKDNITKYYGKSINVIYNNFKTHIRWFDKQEDFYEEIIKYKKIKDNNIFNYLTMNNNSIYYLYNNKDIINVFLLPNNKNCIDLLNNYLMLNGKYSIKKIIQNKLFDENYEVIQFWQSIFKNSNLMPIINWVLTINDVIFKECILPKCLYYFANNENSIIYFNNRVFNEKEYFGKDGEYDGYIYGFYNNSNVDSLKIIKKGIGLIFTKEEIRNKVMISNYLKYYKFMEKILYNYNIYKVSVLNSYWEHIYNNKYCGNIILNKLKEEKTEIDIMKFLTNPKSVFIMINNSKIYKNFEITSKKQYADILTYSNSEVINIISNQLLHIYPIENIEFFIELINEYPLILKNSFFNKIIETILKHEYRKIINKVKFWECLMKNTSEEIIDIIHNFLSNILRDKSEEKNNIYKMFWSNISKRSNVVNFLFIPKNIKKVNWEMICGNPSKKAVYLVYLRMLYGDNPKYIFDNLYSTEYITRLINKINESEVERISNLTWIRWDYLSSNPYGLLIFEKFKNKIVWDNIVTNKSSNPYLLTLIRYGIGLKPTPFTNDTWNFLLSNNNPIIINIIKKKIDSRLMTVDNWKYLSKNSNTDIIDLFNNDLYCRFNIDWNEMSGNSNIHKLSSFYTIVNGIGSVNERIYRKSLSGNNSKLLIKVIRLKLIREPFCSIWSDTNLPFNANIDEILNTDKNFNKKEINDMQFNDFKVFVNKLIIDDVFAIKLLTNQYALKTITKYKSLTSLPENSSTLPPFEKLLPILVKNPSLFCTEQEYKESITYI